MTRRFNLFALALLVLVGGPFYWLLLDNRPGDARPHAVSIAQLRALAGSIPGAAPTGIETELVAYRIAPGDLFAAGVGLKRRLIGVIAYRLPVPGRGPIVIDGGITPSAAQGLGMAESYSPQNQAHVDLALQAASLVLFTHEHSDHMAGFTAIADRPGMIAKAKLNAAQIAPSPDRPWPAGTRLPTPALSGARPQAVAPGVVIIPAPSHTPGSQMIFIRLASGREYLFAGDIATLEASWMELRARSRLLSQWWGDEDRTAVYAWLKTIRALKRQAPALAVIPGHDYEAFDWKPGRLGLRHHFSEDANHPNRSNALANGGVLE